MATDQLVTPTYINWSKNPVVVKLKPNDTDVERVKLKITILNGPGLEVVLTETPDDKGEVLFDISSILDEWMNNEWARHFANIYSLPFDTDVVPINYELYYQVIQIDGTVVDSGVVDDEDSIGGGVYYTLQGGFNYYLAGILGLSGIIDLETQFLSTKPADMILGANEYSELFLFNPRPASVTWAHQYSFFYNDTFLGDYIDGAYVHAAKTFLRFPLNTDPSLLEYWLLTYLSYTGRPTHYYIKLTSDDGETETRAVYLDYKHYRNTTYLKYQNSLNGIDTARFTGEEIKKAELERNGAVLNDGHYAHPTLINSDEYKYHPASGLKKVTSIYETISKKVSTGYKGKKEIESLRDLMLSTNVFEVTPIGDVVPVEITDKTKELYRSGNFETGMEIEYSYKWKDRVYSVE
jgi:hypothetical protein